MHPLFSSMCVAIVVSRLINGTHGLSCRRSQDHYPRHASVKVVVKRSLDSAKIPSRLKSNGVLRSDGKWPDGISLIPWKHNQSLVWDVTCPGTYASSHLSLAGVEVGSVDH